jgi:hypothetical protein
MLTIATSVASGADAVFSLLPVAAHRGGDRAAFRFRDFQATGSTGLANILFESLFNGGLRTDPGDGYWHRVLLSLEVDCSRLAPALLRRLSHEPKWVRQLS